MLDKLLSYVSRVNLRSIHLCHRCLFRSRFRAAARQRMMTKSKRQSSNQIDFTHRPKYQSRNSRRLKTRSKNRQDKRARLETKKTKAMAWATARSHLEQTTIDRRPPTAPTGHQSMSFAGKDDSKPGWKSRSKKQRTSKRTNRLRNFLLKNVIARVAIN